MTDPRRRQQVLDELRETRALLQAMLKETIRLTHTLTDLIVELIHLEYRTPEDPPDRGIGRKDEDR